MARCIKEVAGSYSALIYYRKDIHPEAHIYIYRRCYPSIIPSCRQKFAIDTREIVAAIFFHNKIIDIKKSKTIDIPRLFYHVLVAIDR